MREFTGLKYEETLGKSRREITAMIRADVKAAVKAGTLPDFTYRVRKREFAGGWAVDLIALLPENVREKYTERCGHPFSSACACARSTLRRTLERLGNAYNQTESDVMSDYYRTRYFFDVRIDDYVIRHEVAWQRAKAEADAKLAREKAEAEKVARAAKTERDAALAVVGQALTAWGREYSEEYKEAIAEGYDCVNALHREVRERLRCAASPSQARWLHLNEEQKFSAPREAPTAEVLKLRRCVIEEMKVIPLPVGYELDFSKVGRLLKSSGAKATGFLITMKSPPDDVEHLFMQLED